MGGGSGGGGPVAISFGEPSPAVTTGPSSSSSSRQNFISYLLSVMRTGHNETGLLLPAGFEGVVPPPNIDISAYKHTAYLVDAFVYLFKVFETSWPAGLRHNLRSQQQQEEEPALFCGRPLARRRDTFFRRSDSTLSLAGAGLDPVLAPVTEALPLAVAPQRLHPNSRRSELFGTFR